MERNLMGTILVVDDIPENISTLAGMLRDNYRVLFATSGADALEIVRQQQFDLILLDVMMPGMDGYEVCRRLKADIVTREIPVIFVTALTEVQDETRGLELGAVDFLHKPCHASIVRLRVQLHIERHNRSHSLERLVQERTRELDETRIEIVRRLGRAAEYRDNETGMHVIRMSKSSRLLARAAGVSERQANLLLNAAPMHDIGKIGIPDRVLIKPGPLDPEEWALMKTHPLIGAEIIGDHPSELLQMARIVALTHHEKWDGSGYPHGLAGDGIPLEGRIVTIADVFDALTSERPYKHAWSTVEAVDFMRAQSGSIFDPDLLELFLDLIPQVEDIRRRYADTP
ncbi:two-component system response regulator [Ferribacterium limneticum]|nr:two-component system response regulator [Ferribacterium limneticum]